MRQPIEDAVSVRGAAKFEAGHDERIAQTGIFLKLEDESVHLAVSLWRSEASQSSRQHEKY